MEDWQQFLNNIYFKINEPGAFSGPTKLKSILKQNGYDVSIDKIRVWLEKIDSYNVYKPVRYKFKRNRIVTTGIDHIWDADLADVSNIKEDNDGNSFLLIVIDIFSRFLWVQIVRSKSQLDMKKAFEKLFSSTTRRPSRIRSDNGKEFKNKTVKAYFKRLGIKQYFTMNETKANYAERVIRTIKSLMYRYFYKEQTHRYIDIIQDLVKNYNNRPHYSLKSLSPASITDSNEARVWKQMYIDTCPINKKKRFKFSIGDKVRISHLKYIFQRDYHEKWTEEYFCVKHRFRKASKNIYRLKDLLNDDILGTFYEDELQRIRRDAQPLFRIEKVIRQRNKGRELFVKWQGWPAKFNSWTAPDSVQKPNAA